jgi:hypothetical protein
MAATRPDLEKERPGLKTFEAGTGLRPYHDIQKS